MRLSGVGVDDLVDRPREREPRVRVRGRDLGHRRHHLAELAPVLVEPDAEVRRAGALSNIANVSHAWNTSCATSAGWNGASHGNGRFSAGLEASTA